MTQQEKKEDIVEGESDNRPGSAALVTDVFERERLDSAEEKYEDPGDVAECARSSSASVARGLLSFMAEYVKLRPGQLGDLLDLRF